MRLPRSYRTKLEVLRDFLRAAQEPAPKTRIIGAANLNPLSFRKYLRLCAQQDLIVAVSGGYVATPRATDLLEAIDGLMVKTSELEAALRLVERSTRGGRALDGGGSNPFRHVLREAWNEIALRTPGPPDARWARVPLTAADDAPPTRTNLHRSSGSLPETKAPMIRTTRRRPPAGTHDSPGRAGVPSPNSRLRR